MFVDRRATESDGGRAVSSMRSQERALPFRPGDGAALREKLCELATSAESITLPIAGPRRWPDDPCNNDYQAGFAAGLMLKDLRLAMEAASKAGAKVELGEHAPAIYEVFAKDHARHRFFRHHPHPLSRPWATARYFALRCTI